jgi:hypothetical protein
MTLTRKPLPVTGDWLLTDHNDDSGNLVTAQGWLFQAIAALMPLGWRGSPLASTVGGDIDSVEFQDSTNPLGAQSAMFGQWIVLDAGALRVLSVEDCEAEYEEAS